MKQTQTLWQNGKILFQCFDGDRQTLSNHKMTNDKLNLSTNIFFFTLFSITKLSASSFSCSTFADHTNHLERERERGRRGLDTALHTPTTVCAHSLLSSKKEFRQRRLRRRLVFGFALKKIHFILSSLVPVDWSLAVYLFCNPYTRKNERKSKCRCTTSQ